MEKLDSDKKETEGGRMAVVRYLMEFLDGVDEEQGARIVVC